MPAQDTRRHCSQVSATFSTEWPSKSVFFLGNWAEDVWSAKATPLSVVNCSMVEDTRVVVGRIARRMLLSIFCATVSIYVEN